MRIWDLPVEKLCRNHLLGEHRELHAIWSVLTTGRKGYSRHPETLRWKGKLAALYRRHEIQVQEMRKRGFVHKSPLEGMPSGKKIQDHFIDPPEKQALILRKRCSQCKL